MSKILNTIIIFALIAIVGRFIFDRFDEANVVATKSCMHSIHAAIEAKPQSLEKLNLSSATKKLDRKEANSLFSALGYSNLDGRIDKQGFALDAWGNPLQIEAAAVGGGFRIAVVSGGRDGVFHNSDDITLEKVHVH